jgi:pyruvate dehydrogenase E2 component (dihydrolipoamide acetyltransferase)
VVEKILVEPGTRVPIGTLLAVIRADDEPAPAPVSKDISAPPAAAVIPVPAMRAPMPSAPEAQAGRLHISPVAKKLAAELGIDPTTVTPSGPGGRITREDIEHAAKARTTTAPVAPAPPDRHIRMRQTIAAAMARSKREIPHYYLSTTIVVKRALDWLSQENLKRAVEDRLLYGVLLLKAVAFALREVPELNAVWESGQLVLKPEIHVGVAISLRQGGLIAPALHEVDKKSLGDLMKDFRDLVQRARSGSLRSSELSDSTITVTSLGEQGVEGVFGIIYPPQVALVGFGRIMDRPWVVEGQVVARPLLTATLSGDHRVTDGHRGGLFLTAVDRWLQQPENL